MFKAEYIRDGFFLFILFFCLRRCGRSVIYTGLTDGYIRYSKGTRTDGCMDKWIDGRNDRSRYGDGDGNERTLPPKKIGVCSVTIMTMTMYA
ncbi:hypothetical protein GGS21DRAFT_117940 [Xylaria nigripes]|nr:hypothetical protein GGS21DRAFT_117940 [Xylaria nigripes]